jgi:ankyrin repeat protein
MQTPLQVAVRGGFIDTCRLLFARTDCDVDRTGSGGVTALHIAARFGDIDIAQLLIGHGANVGATTADGTNVFITACASRRAKVATYLMELGTIDINARDEQGATGLVKAVEANCAKLAVQLIRDERINVNQRRPFRTALDFNMRSIAAALLTRPDLDLRPRLGGRTYLHRAIRRGNVEIVAAILSRRVIDVNAQNAKGNTALHIACTIGDVPIVALLLKQPDIDLNRTNAAGRTPLQIATHFPAVALMLIENPTVDVNTGAPVHDLIAGNALKCIAALSHRQDFDVNAVRNGRTPLATAVAEKRRRAMAHLMTRNEVETMAAIEMAKKMEFQGAIRMLKMPTGNQPFEYCRAVKSVPLTESCRETG